VRIVENRSLPEEHLDFSDGERRTESGPGLSLAEGRPESKR
jgi:hypothetical protein